MSTLNYKRRYGFCDPALVTVSDDEAPVVEIELVENSFRNESEYFSFKLNATYAEHLARQILEKLGVETL